MRKENLTDEEKDDKIFELTQEVEGLKKRITYLQEELASAEDTINELNERLE
jgi:hypothetical protein